MTDRRPFGDYKDDERKALEDEIAHPLIRLQLRPGVIQPGPTTMHPFSRRLQQRLVLLSLQAVEDWDAWIEALVDCPRKRLHEAAARSVKGLIKAWRNYLIETR